MDVKSFITLSPGFVFKNKPEIKTFWDQINDFTKIQVHKSKEDVRKLFFYL